MAKRAPQPIASDRSLSRRRPTKEPLPVVYIYCEGKVTEPNYINSFFQEFCKEKRKIIPDPIKAAGVPYTLVEKCIKKKEELRIAGRRDSLQRRSCVWAVFDVDIHPNLPEAIELARANDIPFSLSNPCIEIWGMMHLSVYERPGGRHEAQAALATAMPPYHHEKSPTIPWDVCRDKVKTAIWNSHTSIARRSEERSEAHGANPSTTFHELLGFLSDDHKIDNLIAAQKKK